MATRRGDTLIFQTPPVIAAHAAVGGKKEGEGPLAAGFDALSADNRFGQSGWEAAETQLQLRAARLCLKKAQTTEKEVSLALAGDLQAQCTASNYAMRTLGIPYAGLFGACSTMAEALGLGAALCSAGLADGLLAMASSHFCTAERQFRTPLSYGAVRTPTAQWTATAAGACLLRPAGQGVGIRAVTFGRVQDYQIRDINNMGAAMMPAERRYPIEQVVAELRRHDFAHQRRISFEYIVFRGVNDTPAHVAALTRLLAGLRCRINLIRFHRIPDSPYFSPGDEAMVRFRDALTARGIQTTIRASRGEDIQAACGLLSTRLKGGI